MIFTSHIFHRAFLCIIITVAVSACVSQVETQKTTSTQERQQSILVNWQSEAGMQRFASAHVKQDFFKLANHFESQTNKAFCGPTSATIVLNTLRVRKGLLELPEDRSLLQAEDMQHLPAPNSGFSPFYQRYTQNNVLANSPKSRANILGKPFLTDTGEQIKDIGLQLQQLADLLTHHQVNVSKHVVTENADLSALKLTITEALSSKNVYVVINYHRSKLNQPGGGHISPLAAYDHNSDSFLVMDTNPNRADWVWVDSQTLLSAMQTFDSKENRGFLVIQEGL